MKNFILMKVVVYIIIALLLLVDISFADEGIVKTIMEYKVTSKKEIIFIVIFFVILCVLKDKIEG